MKLITNKGSDTVFDLFIGIEEDEEKKWSSISKAALPSIATIFVYSSLYTILFGRIIQQTQGNSQRSDFLSLLADTAKISSWICRAGIELYDICF